MNSGDIIWFPPGAVNIIWFPLVVSAARASPCQPLALRAPPAPAARRHRRHHLQLVPPPAPALLMCWLHFHPRRRRARPACRPSRPPARTSLKMALWTQALPPARQRPQRWRRSIRPFACATPRDCAKDLSWLLRHSSSRRGHSATEPGGTQHSMIFCSSDNGAAGRRT
eukprot:SAG22_NODE_251_length_13703_cov_6.296582_8_plen_169_part_00